jgi:hypothetical protein
MTKWVSPPSRQGEHEEVNLPAPPAGEGREK